MENKDTEVWVGENRIYLGKDNILYFTPVGKHNEEIAVACRDACLKLMNLLEGKVNLLIDMNKIGKLSSEARKIYREANEHEKTGKVAQLGMHQVAGVIASFVIGISSKKDVRFFKTKEEALAWLKE